jgi:hypothetical protein
MSNDWCGSEGRSSCPTFRQQRQSEPLTAKRSASTGARHREHPMVTSRAAEADVSTCRKFRDAEALLSGDTMVTMQALSWLYTVIELCPLLSPQKGEVMAATQTVASERAESTDDSKL